MQHLLEIEDLQQRDTYVVDCGDYRLQFRLIHRMQQVIISRYEVP